MDSWTSKCLTLLQKTPLPGFKPTPGDVAHRRVIKTLGRGGYGQVVECWKEDTKELVAIKFFACAVDVEFELEALKTMEEAGMENTNIVKFLGEIETPLGTALAFEHLQETLFNYVNEKETLPLCDVRSILSNIGTALSFLTACGYVHRDIKLDNIMVCKSTHPVEVKLIDFGFAEKIEYLQPYAIASLLEYRAPEMILRGPYDGGIDVWALGASIISAMVNSKLIPCESELQVLSTIVKLLGQPPDEVLNSCNDTEKYFDRVGHKWTLKPGPCSSHFTDQYPSLRALIEDIYKVSDEEEVELECLIDLLERMLDVNSITRITAGRICTHPFITRSWEEKPVAESEDEERQYTQDKRLRREIEHLLPSNYKVINILGYANAGVMTQCEPDVSVLILPVDAEKEALMLRKMMKKGLHNQNIVELIEIIDDAVVLETLDQNLEDYQLQRTNLQAPIWEICKISEQIATALVALQAVKLTHGKLTMRNIWFTDCKKDLSIKMVDFTSAFHKVDDKARATLKSAPYRAPEVILGLPITRAVDVWSMACIMARMLLGSDILLVEDDFVLLKRVVQLFGQPSDKLLDAGTKVKNFFKKTKGSWRLMTDEEYILKHKLSTEEFQTDETQSIKAFPDLVKKVKQSMYWGLELDSCVDLLMRMFEVDAAKRITPAEILHHKFITIFTNEEEEEEEDEEEDEKEEENESPYQSSSSTNVQPVICHTTEPQRSALREMAHGLVTPERVELFSLGSDPMPCCKTSCHLEINSASNSRPKDIQTCTQRKHPLLSSGPMPRISYEEEDEESRTTSTGSFTTDSDRQRGDFIKQKIKDKIGAGGFGAAKQRVKRVSKVIHGVWSWMKKSLTCWNNPAA